MISSHLPIAGHRASLCIALTLGVITLCLYQQLMAWVLLLMCCAVGSRVFLFKGAYQRAPGTRTINMLALLTCVALGWFSRDQGLLLTMVNLLVCACALKLLLLQKHRDFLQVSGCCLFLIGCTFIFSQDLFATILYAVILMAALLSLQLLYAPQQPFKGHVKTLLKMALQALPIAVILFLVLPHLPPFWGMPEGKSSETGLSEKMTPGDIANLTQSTERVFTATFDNALPAPQQRYWRAMVLEHFDGYSWQVADYRKARQQLLPLMPSQSSSEAVQSTIDSPAWRYQLLSEPSGNSWLYALGYTRPQNSSTAQKTWRGEDYTLMSRQPILSKQAFSLVSYPRTPQLLSPLAQERQVNLQYPEQTNPRTREWALALRLQSSSNADYIKRLLAYFADSGFRYTLQPAVMRHAPVDAFLFDYQAGFCAHYASAMTLALRIAGIPARVVSGYQGGQLLDEKVLNVFQYDAHAWVEASIDGKHWQRFDPTSVVAASRLLYGFQNAMADQQEDLPLFSRARSHNSAMVAGVYQFMDNINYQWNRWVLGFDGQTQQDFFTRILGHASIERMTLFSLAVVLFIAGLLAFYFMPRPTQRNVKEPLRLYQHAAAKLHRVTGLPRDNLPARVYQQRLNPLLDKADQQALAQFIACFEAVEYQPEHAAKQNLLPLRASYKVLMRSLKTRGPFKPSRN